MRPIGGIHSSRGVRKGEKMLKMIFQKEVSPHPTLQCCLAPVLRSNRIDEIELKPLHIQLRLGFHQNSIGGQIE